jgi:hypothetical protein
MTKRLVHPKTGEWFVEIVIVTGKYVIIHLDWKQQAFTCSFREWSICNET